MAKPVTIQFEGELVQAEQLEFEAEKEPWTEYKLEDGTVLRIRTILASVVRLVGRYKPDGEPIYVLGMGGIPVLQVPTELRHAPSKQKAETSQEKPSGRN